MNKIKHDNTAASEDTLAGSAHRRLGVPRDPCVSTLKGVGPQTHRHLRDLNLDTVSSLLFHLPHHYENHTRITPLNQLIVGERVVLEGKITAIQETGTPPKRLRCQLTDATNTVTLLFFHGAHYLKNQLRIGQTLRSVGTVSTFQGKQQLVQPQLLDAEQPLNDTLTPIYPITKNLPQSRMRSLINQALELAQRRDWLKEMLPKSVLHTENLPTLAEAINALHRPPRQALDDDTYLRRARQRLGFEAMITHFLGLARLGETQAESAQPLTLSPTQHETVCDCFPFELTEDQKNALSTLLADSTQAKPLSHLLQGDVGSGKTAVAAALAFAAYCHQGQTAIMAPTELLARQHAAQLEQWFAPLGIRVALFSSRLSHRERQQRLTELQTGGIDIAVGTQALIQPDIAFQHLMVCVIDEQHRFGVEQRLTLKEKGANPHVLLMSATPIPRTLAMTLYGDMRIIELKHRPAGRQPITTTVMCDTHRESLLNALKAKCLSGEHVFWVCPRIFEETDDPNSEDATLEHTDHHASPSSIRSDTTDSNTIDPDSDSDPDPAEINAALSTALPAEKAFTQFQQYFADIDLRIGLLHGQLPEMEKTAILEAFRDQQLPILVATTVIEVGIDIPTANIIVIEAAERFGLSQLHQLRGRVGRGGAAGYCILLYQHPLSAKGKARLGALRDSQDGFYLADKDLEQRGPGLWLGTAQSGSYGNDFDEYACTPELMQSAKTIAKQLHQQQPDIANALYARWQPKPFRYANT